MSDLVAVGALTAGLTFVAMPLVLRGLHVLGVLDVPNERSSHSSPTPRGGGLACAVGIAVGLVAAASLGLALPWPQIAATFLLCAVGFADDVWSLPVAVRLSSQLAAGAFLGAVLGGVVAVLPAALITAAVVNAVNFMDGINGITALTVAAWAVAVISWVPTGAALMLLAVLALGAGVGFLPWNVPRARVFLGDSGSYLFGGLISSALVTAWPGRGEGALWLVAVPLGVYLFDTGFTMLKRALASEAVFKAHRSHLYQRLQVATAWPHWAVSVAVASIALLTGWVAGTKTPLLAAAVVMISLGAYLGLVVITERRYVRSGY